MLFMLYVFFVDLLQSMHMLGKQGDNIFSSDGKLSESSSQANQNHPVFGVKRDLIRLVGNMSYRHKDNQDKVSHVLLNMSSKFELYSHFTKTNSVIQFQLWEMLPFIGNFNWPLIG